MGGMEGQELIEEVICSSSMPTVTVPPASSSAERTTVSPPLDLAMNEQMANLLEPLTADIRLIKDHTVSRGDLDAAVQPLRDDVANDLSWMEMCGVAVPTWCYCSDVAKCAGERWPLRQHERTEGSDTHDTELRLLKYLGKVVCLGIQANVVTWAPFLFVPWYLQGYILCGIHGHDSEEAHIPDRMPLVFLPIVLWNLCLEIRAFRHILPCVLRATTLKIFGKECTFWIFVFCYAGPLSVMANLGKWGKTMVLMEIVKTGTVCNDDTQHLSFAAVAVVLWLAMLLQIPYIWLAVWPTGAVEDTKNKIPYPEFNRSELKNVLDRPNVNCVYKTRLEPNQTHQLAIFYVADGARWASIQCCELCYFAVQHKARKAGSTAMKALKRTVTRFVLLMALESTGCLVLQIAVLKDRTKRNPGASQWFNILSLFFGAIMGLYGMFDTYERVASYYKDVHIGHGKFRERLLEDQTKTLEHFPDEPRAIQDADWWYWLFFVFASIETLVLMQAISTIAICGNLYP